MLMRTILHCSTWTVLQLVTIAVTIDTIVVTLVLDVDEVRILVRVGRIVLVQTRSLT